MQRNTLCLSGLAVKKFIGVFAFPNTHYFPVIINYQQCSRHCLALEIILLSLWKPYLHFGGGGERNFQAGSEKCLPLELNLKQYVKGLLLLA